MEVFWKKVVLGKSSELIHGASLHPSAYTFINKYDSPRICSWKFYRNIKNNSSIQRLQTDTSELIERIHVPLYKTYKKIDKNFSLIISALKWWIFVRANFRKAKNFAFHEDFFFANEPHKNFLREFISVNGLYRKIMRRLTFGIQLCSDI